MFRQLQQRVARSLLIASFAFTIAAATELQERATTIPAPLVFNPDQNWDGIDGSWSSFTLRVGTPQQYVRVFPATSSQQVWVVRQDACSTSTNVPDCISNRGGVFNISASTSWDPIGSYSLWIEQNLGYNGDGDYGYDTIGMGGVGEGGATITNATVGAMWTQDFYLGTFGLHSKPTNFSGFAEGSPSYITKLQNQGLIPSLTFGYTAGSPYRFTKVLASLTLGGYDASRFVGSKNVSVTMAPDNERDIVVGLQSVKLTDNTRTGLQLMPTPAYMYIDSLMPQIWLPLDACKKFEDAFGLIYDNTTDLYLINNTLHSSLVASGANVTFTIGGSTTGGPTVDIVLPYAAFDQQAKAPYRGLTQTQSYFPLRRAHNETQYVLGRTFLQEAYLIVDWERQNFTVSPCNWVASLPQNIVPILSINETNSLNTTASTSQSDQPPKGGISIGAIVGIAIGVVAVFFCLGCFLAWRYLSRRHKRQLEELRAEKGEGDKGNILPKPELQGSEVNRANSSESGTLLKPGFSSTTGTLSSNPDSPAPPSEVEAKERPVFEMPGDEPVRQEAAGRQLGEKEAMVVREARINGVDPNPTPPPSAGHQTRRAPVSPSEVSRFMGTDSDIISPVSTNSNPNRVLSPVSIASANSDPNRRRFSFED